MFLTEANVLHYLVERQFADFDAAVNGAFSVRPLTRRNRNFHVTCGGREYLVKQAKQWSVPGRASVEREAAFYARNLPLTLAPQCYAYDPPNSTLVLEFLPGHRELYDVPDRFSPQLGRLCGEVLGAFHREMETGGLASLFPGSMPAFLSLHERTEEDLTDASAAQRELARVVKKHAGFGRALGQLRAEWRPDTLIHGDLKLENCLISPARDRLRVVDWEFAAWGDSCWDVSALLQSYWNFWIRRPGEFEIAAIQPALRAFLRAYAQARAWDPAACAARAIRFAGARMLQAAFEALDKLERITAAVVRLMQGSLHILTRPDWAAEQLLGSPQCMPS